MESLPFLFLPKCGRGVLKAALESHSKCDSADPKRSVGSSVGEWSWSSVWFWMLIMVGLLVGFKSKALS